MKLSIHGSTGIDSDPCGDLSARSLNEIIVSPLRASKNESELDYGHGTVTSTPYRTL
jgi:hypothetical protein